MRCTRRWRTWALPPIAALLLTTPLAADRHKADVDPETDDGILLQRIQQERTPEGKQELLEKYSAEYPHTTSIAWVYEQLIAIYKNAKDQQKVLAIANALLSVDPNDLDAANDALRASEATGAKDLIRIFAQRAWDIASKVVQTKKPSDPDDAADWSQQLDFAHEVLTYSEFVMATQAAAEQDPARRAAFIEDLRSRNPQSKFLPNANKQTVIDLAKTDPEKAAALAEQGLLKDPNNEDFLMVAADYKIGHEKDLPRVLNYSLRIMELMKSKPRPATLSAEAWEQKKAKFTAVAAWMAGVVYGKQAHYAESDRYLREALPYILDNSRLLAAAYYYLGYDNYAMATELSDLSRAIEAVKYSKLCAAMNGPFQPLARRTLASVRSDFSVE